MHQHEHDYDIIVVSSPHWPLPCSPWPSDFFFFHIFFFLLFFSCHQRGLDFQLRPCIKREGRKNLTATKQIHPHPHPPTHSQSHPRGQVTQQAIITARAKGWACFCVRVACQLRTVRTKATRQIVSCSRAKLGWPIPLLYPSPNLPLPGSFSGSFFQARSRECQVSLIFGGASHPTRRPLHCAAVRCTSARSFLTVRAASAWPVRTGCVSHCQCLPSSRFFPCCCRRRLE